MKTRYFFILALLCLLFSSFSLKAQNLNTRVTLQVKNASLAQVLQKMQHKYGFRFSYMNNEMPAGARFSAEIKDKPLSNVLDVLFENTDLGYKQNKSQIIIKKGFPKNKPKTTTFQKPAAENRPKTVSKPSASTGTKKPAEAETTETPEPEIAMAEPEPDSPRPEDEMADEPEHVRQPKPKQPGFFGKLKARRKANEARAAASDSLLKNKGHFGFIFPASTNGLQANKYVNEVTAHLLIGTAAGLEGAEFSGFGNIDQCYADGVQFAGVFNVVQGKPTGNQTEDSIRDNQIVTGAQFAGLVNVADGNVNGGQFSGFLNTASQVKGIQSAGFMNTSGKLNGVQAAGFMNVGRNLKGAQLAGFMNTAETVTGLQAAGFLNRAKTVKGAQLGFINVADSVSGVSIGFLSLVDKGGYKRAEFYLSDEFDANFTFKIGMPKFYTMLALGVEPEDQERWGVGGGFGAEWSLNKVLKVNTDVLSYHVFEQSFKDLPYYDSDMAELNMLNKFRLLGTIQIAKHLAVFGGPTYNVMVSQHQNAGTTEPGSTLAPDHTFYNHTSDNGTNVKMWVGFNVGLRF